MAKTPKSGKTSAKGKGVGRSLVWLSGLACGVLAAVTPGAMLLAAGLLAPGLLALKLDTEPGRPKARSVLTCGLASTVHPIAVLWNAGQSLDTAWALVLDPSLIAVAWGAAAAGWLLTELMPLGVRTVLEAGALTRAARLRLARERIAEAWGLDARQP